MMPLLYGYILLLQKEENKRKSMGKMGIKTFLGKMKFSGRRLQESKYQSPLFFYFSNQSPNTNLPLKENSIYNTRNKQENTSKYILDKYIQMFDLLKK